MIEIAQSNFLKDANLQGYWRLEADGTDSGPNGYNLTVTNAPAFVSAVFGSGVDLENTGGEDKYLSVADASCANLEIAGSQSWCAWVKLESYTGNERILSKFGAGTEKNLWVTGTQKFAFTLAGLTTNTTAIGTTNAATGSWFFVVGVYDSANSLIKIYVNAVMETDETASGSATDTNGVFAIGRKGGTDSNYFDGIVDDVAIFNRALTAAEITYLYTNSIGGSFLLSMV
jgi:hypothetical protein